MFLPLSLDIIRFSAPPLVSSTPGAESNSAGGAKKILPNFFSALPKLISAPAKINSAHATDKKPGKRIMVYVKSLVKEKLFI